MTTEKACAGSAGMEFVIGQQLNAAGEVFLQDFDREAVARTLVGGNIVQRLLEGQPVQGLGSIGEEALQKVGDALLAGGRLQVGVMLDRSHDCNRGTG